MHMYDEWISALRSWAARNESISELWVFGSRAHGIPRPFSDIDIAVALMPPQGKHDPAYTAFHFSFDEWKVELRTILDWDVNLAAIGRDFPMDLEVRTTGIRLWRRKDIRRKS